MRILSARHSLDYCHFFLSPFSLDVFSVLRGRLRRLYIDREDGEPLGEKRRRELTLGVKVGIRHLFSARLDFSYLTFIYSLTLK